MEKDHVLTFLRDIDNSEAAGIDRLRGRFLKNGADVLANSVTDICNLSISLNKFPRALKLPIYLLTANIYICMYSFSRIND